MFFGMMLVDAALAAWAVGMMGQPNAPKWLRFVIVWLGVTLIVSVAGVVALDQKADNELAGWMSRVAPLGAAFGASALVAASVLQRRASRK